MLISLLPCPPVGHKQFQKNLSQILIGDADTPEQISKFIRAKNCTLDDLGLEFLPGELQKRDLVAASTMFEHKQFITSVFNKNIDLFRISQCRIYQFQTIPKSGVRFIFGSIITDGSHNLIDFCLDSRHAEKRRAVLIRLIRAICTPESIARKISH